MNDQAQRKERLPYLIKEHGDEVHLLQYLDNSQKRVVVPETVSGKPVTAIGESCFNRHQEIEEIILPDSLVSIGAFAFAMCSGLHHVAFSDSISEIGSFAFRDCRGLRGGTIILPAHLKTLSHSLFSFTYMDNVDLKLPTDLQLIENHAFYSAGAFDLVISNPDIVIQDGAFAQSGIHVVTTQPVEKGWFMDWPYGQTIRSLAGESGVIEDYRFLGDSCMELTVIFGVESRKLFYPSPTAEYSFVSEESQRMMWDTLSKTNTVRDIFRQWQRGVL